MARSRPSRRLTATPARPGLLPFQRFFINLLRREKWSIREAAAKVGIAGPNAWAYVQGLNTPHERVQEEVAKLAGVDVTDVARLVWEQRKLRRAALQAQRQGTGLSQKCGHRPVAALLRRDPPDGRLGSLASVS